MSDNALQKQEILEMVYGQLLAAYNEESPIKGSSMEEDHILLSTETQRIELTVKTVENTINEHCTHCGKEVSIGEYKKNKGYCVVHKFLMMSDAQVQALLQLKKGMEMVNALTNIDEGFRWESMVPIYS